MTITQRIELRRLGYTKEEIAELAEMEKTPDPPAEPEPTPPAEPEPTPPAEPEPKPDPQAEILAAINKLTLAIQGNRLNTNEQPDPPKPETATDIFNNILKG